MAVSLPSHDAIIYATIDKPRFTTRRGSERHSSGVEKTMRGDAYRDTRAYGSPAKVPRRGMHSLCDRIIGIQDPTQGGDLIVLSDWAIRDYDGVGVVKQASKAMCSVTNDVDNIIKSGADGNNCIAADVESTTLRATYPV